MMSGAPVERDTIVVTGGAGFIGSELVRQLAARGRRVVVIDNLVNGHRRNLEDVLSDTVTLRACDIRDLDAWADVLPVATCVYHLACLGVRHSLHSPFENHEVNATATLHALAACRDAYTSWPVPLLVFQRFYLALTNVDIASGVVNSAGMWISALHIRHNIDKFRLGDIAANGF